ncbi:MAG: ADP-ribosylglycohydrolase family protein [Bacteroidales bacterium]|nr:ADP-ribosylglycohydrolase family protein [Bacteroidales bacterium]
MKQNCPVSHFLLAGLLAAVIISCSTAKVIDKNPDLKYRAYIPDNTDRAINRAVYYDKLQGFWLGTSIGNWTGLVTEMDKIGNIGEIKTGDFYTRYDWGKPDQPSIWGQGIPSDLSPAIDFVFAGSDSIWGADDDSDIEYIYQELLLDNQTSVLTGDQIRDGWLKHIRHEEENYLWVSNQKAFDLMKEGFIPPATGDPANNPEYEMIDAQLTTEIFGLFAPARPDIALKMALLPVQTTARENSQWISEFYVTMFSLASAVDETLPMKEQVFWMAEQAKERLPQTSFAFKMYDYVKSKCDEGILWEQARDSVYYRYQVNQSDRYDMTSRNLYCNGCFAAGINFAASLISLFYGEGDLMETIKIGTLAGWDSDNPTATWGGLLGFMTGREGIEKAFNRKFSNRFDIHRTRVGFENGGIDSFENMARKGIWVTDRVVQEEMKGGIDLKNNLWYIPKTNITVSGAEGN